MSDILLIQLRKLGDDLSVERFTVRRTTLAAADEITELREQLATVTVERDELLIKHQVACDTIERQHADIDTIRGYFDAMKGSCERVSKERDEYRAALELAWQNQHNNGVWNVQAEEALAKYAPEDEIEQARRMV